jgi:hypothetical protein
VVNGYQRERCQEGHDEGAWLRIVMKSAYETQGPAEHGATCAGEYRDTPAARLSSNKGAHDSADKRSEHQKPDPMQLRPPRVHVARDAFYLNTSI